MINHENAECFRQVVSILREAVACLTLPNPSVYFWKARADMAEKLEAFDQYLNLLPDASADVLEKL